MNTNSESVRQKKVVYQVFIRLFGNKNTRLTPWGTLDENGTGKFNDFTDIALNEIRKLGVTHIWYTGALHHALVNDYKSIGISDDHPDVVKGRAGSPYAIKDYYNVNPDLALDPSRRLEEFENLIERTHKNGLKVIIDIVPNHVARNYQSITLPNGIEDLGANDYKSVEYKRDNNFYYISGQKFKAPAWKDGYLPLGGEYNSLFDTAFEEIPAKWTGNNVKNAQPDYYDWYETVKLNYGIEPNGNRDFTTLPDGFKHKSLAEHNEFWKMQDVPNTWLKIKDIVLYWLEKGVDGLRYDMAEMVPVEFWSYLNSAIKANYPDTFLLAEVYQPQLYHEYLFKGKMDYLYDKVELYDTLKSIIQGHGSCDNIALIMEEQKGIEHQMLHFLENHDEQRIVSPDFAGSANKGKPLMVLSATISSSPTMLYFGQEFGEPASEDPGFGSPTRTTIFDYWRVPSIQRWSNNGSFDGGQLTNEENQLREFYKHLLNFSLTSTALTGEYMEIHSYNRHNTSFYSDKIYSFVRWSEKEKLVVICNCGGYPNSFDLKLPDNIIQTWEITNGRYILTDVLTQKEFVMEVEQIGKITLSIAPFESFIFSL